MSSQNTPITPIADDSPATTMQIKEYKCSVDSHDADKDTKAQRPWIEVYTDTYQHFPKVQEGSHQALGGPRMKLFVAKGSPYAVVGKKITVICSREKGSTGAFFVSIKAEK